PNTTKHENRSVAAAPNNAFSAHRPLFSYKFFLIDHVKQKRQSWATRFHYRYFIGNLLIGRAAPAVLKSTVFMQISRKP
ncbi:MAG TPA: hypothetical protein DCY27_05245, partial [Desulfobacterales bacterium]|nr:hypothetical protein [Desulfobacterales bacterium]